MNEEVRHESSGSQRKLVRKLVLLAVGMFGFGFALWPLYGVFCDLTGFGGRSIQIAEQGVTGEQSDRQVKIRFDATVNSALPWEFKALQKVDIVTLGEMNEGLYLAKNPTGQSIAGHAIYNVTPPEASLYFVKTECFCFTQQVLQGNESREMPVYYFIQADLPEYIKEITLSYTFFPDKNADNVALAPETSAPAGNRDIVNQ